MPQDWPPEDPNRPPIDPQRLQALRERRAAELALSDRCAWCRGPMPHGEFQMLHSQMHHPPHDLLSHVVYAFLLGDRPVHAWPIDPDAPEARQGFNLTFTLCSPACRDTLAELIQSQAVSSTDVDRLPSAALEHERSPEARALALEVLDNVCAWCSRELAPDDRVTAVFGKFHEPRGDENQTAGEEMITVPVGGRKIPAYVAVPGSPVALEGYHVAFKICSPACVAALEAAIAGDNLMSVIH